MAHIQTTVFPAGSAARQVLEEAAAEARCVVICGIPGVGKSLFVHQQTHLAQQHGRQVSRLEWDVARLAFDQPTILERYPEIDDVTHPVIRRAAGLWARRALAQWFGAATDRSELLVIEAPLIGGRLIELARIAADEAEAHLAAPGTLFLVPQPSRAVRAAIETARARESAQHRHALDGKNAPPVLVDALWRQMLASADALGLARDPDDVAYSPELYFAVYRQLLRHRQVRAVPVTEVVRFTGSPHDLGDSAPSLSPSAAEARHFITEVETQGVATAARSVERWYLP